MTVHLVDIHETELNQLMPSSTDFAILYTNESCGPGKSADSKLTRARNIENVLFFQVTEKWHSLYVSERYKSTSPMVKKKGFTEADKKRIMRKESETHGEIRKDSFAADVQKRVDKSKSK